RGREQPLTEERDARRRVGAGIFLIEDDLLAEIGAAAAVLDGPREADPAIGAEDVLPLEPDVPAGLVGGATAGSARGELPGEVLAQPGAHLLPEGGLGRGVGKVHGINSTLGPLGPGNPTLKAVRARADAT